MTILRTAPDSRSAEPRLAEPRLAELRVAEKTPPTAIPMTADLLGLESIKSELQKLSAANQELLRAFNSRADITPRPKNFGSSGNILLPSQADEFVRLKDENARLRQESACLAEGNGELSRRVEELESQLQNATPESWQAQQSEFEGLLEEKSDVIRRLHMTIQELKDELHGGPLGPTKEQVEEMHADFERRLARLKEDEDALQVQAREMEMAMAKERAELARQRADLQRLHNDVTREIEMAGRDPGLRERLANLQRRSDSRPKTMTALPSGERPLAAPPPSLPASSKRPTTMAAIDLDAESAYQEDARPSLFRRLFGG